MEIVKAFACVDVNADGGLMKFAENVAVNRFMPAKACASASDAGNWLLGEHRWDTPGTRSGGGR